MNSLYVEIYLDMLTYQAQLWLKNQQPSMTYGTNHYTQEVVENGYPEHMFYLKYGVWDE